MNFKKYIYLRPDIDEDDEVPEGHQWANVHVLVGYCPQTIPNYMKMIEELQKTFPQIDANEVGLGQVHSSSYVKGFTIITWGGFIPKGEYDGWFVHENGQMEYYW